MIYFKTVYTFYQVSFPYLRSAIGFGYKQQLLLELKIECVTQEWCYNYTLYHKLYVLHFQSSKLVRKVIFHREKKHINNFNIIRIYVL